MKLTVETYEAPQGGRQQCANAYCQATPIWSVGLNFDEPTTNIQYVCGTHLMSYVNTGVDNMRIRRK